MSDDDLLDFEGGDPYDPHSILDEIHSPVTESFKTPLEAKGELLKYGRDIISLHRKVAMGLLPDFQGDRQLLNARGGCRHARPIFHSSIALQGSCQAESTAGPYAMVREKGTGPFAACGPAGALHKRVLSPFSQKST